ncbi:MAG TPA: hypothetical protein VFZ36_00585 [Vicinamibacterales bacterium]
MLTRRILLCALVAAGASLASACSSGTAASLELQNVSSGYFDAGIVNGENKIVPSITFTLHNKGSEPASNVQLNVHFRVVDQDGNMDEKLVRAVGSDGLAPGQASEPITVRSDVGYTSQQSRADMLTNSNFRDVQVRVFGKSGSEQWVPIGEAAVERTILVR